MLLPYPEVKRSTVLIGVSLILVLFVVKPEEFYYLYLANNFHISLLSLNIINQATPWVELIIVYFYCLGIERQPFLLWEESQRSLSFYISSVFFILFITFVGGVLVYYLMYSFGWYNIYEKLHTGNPTSISMNLLYVTTAAVVEEFIYRGYLMPRLQVFFKNNYLTVFISAIVFALAHIMFGNITNTIFPLFGGLIYGYFYWKYRNIKVLIICHFITDLVFVLLQNK